MDLSYDDVRQILALIDASSLEEVEIELGDFKLVVRKRLPGVATGVDGGPPAPMALGATERDVRAAGAASTGHGRQRGAAPGEVELKAPMVGTFYRAPAPGAPPFVEAGGLVGPDDVVAIIEVMKLMNSIRAGHRARVVEILADNGALVEYGQPLMILAPID